VAQYLGETAVQLTVLMDDDARLMAVKVASTLPGGEVEWKEWKEWIGRRRKERMVRWEEGRWWIRDEGGEEVR
jgi:hypothetical protein